MAIEQETFEHEQFRPVRAPLISPRTIRRRKSGYYDIDFDFDAEFALPDGRTIIVRRGATVRATSTTGHRKPVA